MTLIALFIVALLNAGIIPAIGFEDEPIVAVMGEVAVGALIEQQPACDGGTTLWDFNRDNSDGLAVIGLAGEACEFAAEFYRSPETGLWQFAVNGS